MSDNISKRKIIIVIAFMFLAIGLYYFKEIRGEWMESIKALQ